MRGLTRAGVAAIAVLAMIMTMVTGTASAASRVAVPTFLGGSGTAETTGYNAFGGSMKGELKSTRNHRLYYEGLIVYDFNTDAECGRMTGNVNSSNSTPVTGSCGANPQVGKVSGMKFRICWDATASPDPCGDWSAKSS